MKILVSIKGHSTIGGPCPKKNCHARIDQARDHKGVLMCTFDGAAANWCGKCESHVFWDDGGWKITTAPVTGADCFKSPSELDEPLSLEVVVWVSSDLMADSDCLPHVSWEEDRRVPCFFIGAWGDGFDFLDTNHSLVVEQREHPQRHFFVFNRTPSSMAEIEVAIKALGE